jgi:diguanylate cyclase (GGDEF)-like protein
LKFTRRDGIDAILSVSVNFNENDAGRVIGIDGIVHDITDKNFLEEALLTEKQKMEQILEFSEVVSMIKEFDELIDCTVQRVAKVLEAQKCSVMLIDEQNENLMVVGAKGMDEKIAKNVRMKLGEPIAGVVAGEGNPLLVKNIEYDAKFQRANRPMYFGRSFIIVPLKLGGRVKGVINVSDKTLKKSLNKGSKLNYEEVFNEIDLRILCAISREVSVALENVRLFEELNSLAVTDPLTHIYNYRQFSKSLDYEIKRCRRSECSLSIIMIDLDDLKVYNDTFGHLEGDALLKNLGKIFKDQLREVDIVCRYAGDEFAIILPDTDLEGARQAAQKIKNAVSQFKFKKEVTLSYGIAKYGDKLSQYDLVQNADKALYSAKQAGKNCIRVHQE